MGHLAREGAACGCPWTANVCRKNFEARAHVWSVAEVEDVAPENNAGNKLHQAAPTLATQCGRVIGAG